MVKYHEPILHQTCGKPNVLFNLHFSSLSPSLSPFYYLPIISLLVIIAVAFWTDLLGPVEFNLTWCYIIPLAFLAMVSIGILIVRALYIRCNPKNVVLKVLIQIVPLLIWGAVMMALHHFFA